MADSSGSQKRPTPSELVAGANPQMAKTVALVVVALIIGIVMLNIVDDGGTTAKVSTGGNTQKTTTTKHTSSTGSTPRATTTTTGRHKLIAPAALQVIVLNAGGPDHSAANVSAAIKTSGYTKQLTAKTATYHQSGITVHCKPGLEAEGAALVKKIKVPSYTVKLAAWKVRTGVPATVQCYVAIGAAG